MTQAHYEERPANPNDTPVGGYTSVFLTDDDGPYNADPVSGEWVTDGSGTTISGPPLTTAINNGDLLFLNKNVFIDTAGAATIRLQFLGNAYALGEEGFARGEEFLHLMNGSGSGATPSSSLSFRYIDGSGTEVEGRSGGVLPIIGGLEGDGLDDKLLEFALPSDQDLDTPPNLWVETQPNISVIDFTDDGIWLVASTTYDDTDEFGDERHDLGYMVLRYDANGDIMDYVPPSGSVGTGSSPGGSGDPYIHSLAGSIYKLPDMPGNCRFLSTKQGVEDRFLVDISVEKLRFEEQKALLQELLTYDRDILEKYKLPLDGYYFRNFYISNQNSYIVVNLENGTIKTTDSEKSIKSLYENGGILDYQSFNIEIIKSQLADRKTVANYDLVEMDYTVRIKTHNKIYGNIVVELYSLLNKQIRNSIKITAQYPITLNNSRGAYLMPQHTDNMYVKELGSKKKIKDATNYKENEYKTLTETYYKTNPIEKYTRTLLIQQ